MLSEQLKRKAVEDPTEAPGMLINKVLCETKEDDKNHLGCEDRNSLKQIIRHTRKHSMPHDIPRSQNNEFNLRHFLS